MQQIDTSFIPDEALAESLKRGINYSELNNLKKTQINSGNYDYDLQNNYDLVHNYNNFPSKSNQNVSDQNQLDKLKQPSTFKHAEQSRFSDLFSEERIFSDDLSPHILVNFDNNNLEINQNIDGGIFNNVMNSFPSNNSFERGSNEEIIGNIETKIGCNIEDIINEQEEDDLNRITFELNDILIENDKFREDEKELDFEDLAHQTEIFMLKKEWNDSKDKNISA